MPFVSIFRPPFVAAYGAMPGRTVSLCTEQTLMIFPCPRGVIRLATSRPTRKALVRLVSSSRYQSVSAKLDKGGAMLDPRIADQDLDRADVVFDPGDPGHHGCRIGDVEGLRHHRGARGFGQLTAGPVECAGVATVEHDGRPCLGETPRQRSADAAARAGDQCDAPGDVEQRVGTHVPDLGSVIVRWGSRPSSAERGAVLR